MDSEPYLVSVAARHAYAGGRIEAIKIGNAPKTHIYKYDINSAYPAAIQHLPCLAHGEWFRTTKQSEISDFSVIHLRWCSRMAPFYPFFYRQSDGSITYPHTGEGWYWYPEYIAALENPDIEVEVYEVYVHKQQCEHRPFSWVPDVYASRLKFKADGNYAQYAVKLGMNALYGKMAQQAGYASNGRKPQYHQLCWAGYVTSFTRAKMYQESWPYADQIIAYATDGIFTTAKFDVPIDNKLGGWSVDEYDGITVAQAGVYWLRHGNEWEAKYRGFDKGCLDRNAIVEAWRSHSSYAGKVTRFVGVGSALASEKFYATWRQWVTSTRELNIYPTGKRVENGTPKYNAGLRLTTAMPNITPETISQAYTIEWDQEFYLDREKIDGVDIRTIEQEEMDSYA